MPRVGAGRSGRGRGRYDVCHGGDPSPGGMLLLDEWNPRPRPSADREGDEAGWTVWARGCMRSLMPLDVAPSGRGAASLAEAAERVPFLRALTEQEVARL